MRGARCPVGTENKALIIATIVIIFISMPFRLCRTIHPHTYSTFSFQAVLLEAVLLAWPPARQLSSSSHRPLSSSPHGWLARQFKLPNSLQLANSKITVSTLGLVLFMPGLPIAPLCTHSYSTCIMQCFKQLHSPAFKNTLR